MPTGALNFSFQAHRFKQFSRSSAHGCFLQLAEATHWNHDILLRGEILHEEVKLKNEADEFITLAGKLVIPQMRDRLRFEHDRACVGLIEEAENVKECALATSRRPDHGMDASRFKIERDSTKRMHTGFIFAEVALDSRATQAWPRSHALEPRKMATGAKPAARRAGT